jgi:hypothetical protein
MAVFLFYLLFGIIYLIIAVFWARFCFTVLDLRLRQWLGPRLGVTIRQRRGHWQVAEPNQGVRGLLIELLHPLFLAPALILPLLCFAFSIVALFFRP